MMAQLSAPLHEGNGSSSGEMVKPQPIDNHTHARDLGPPLLRVAGVPYQNKWLL